MKTHGYSLWLVPEPSTEAFRSLRQLVEELAQVYHSPVFQPHVTLFGGVEDTEENLRRKVRGFADGLVPLYIDLNGAESKGAYFQALFATATRTRSLLRANILAEKLFGIAHSDCYLPHLSFVYGTFGDGEIVRLRKLLEQRDGLFQEGKSFIAKRVQLWHTEGTAAEGHLVAEFPLNGKGLQN